MYADTMPRVLGYALRRTDEEEAKDAVAETFMIAWRRLERVPGGAESLPWLLATTRKVLANQRRARGSRVRIATASSGARMDPDLADGVVGAATLMAAFASLSERDREVLALVAWDGLEPREGAVVLGCSAATFSVRLHRARRRLASKLADDTSAAIATEETA